MLNPPRFNKQSVKTVTNTPGGTLKKRTWQTTEEYEAAKREAAELKRKHKGAAFFFLVQTYGGDVCVLN